jgi:hypothetical protein
MRLLIGIRQHPIAAVVSWLLLTFLVLFPKGGIKVGDTPLTWGYLILGFTAVPLCFVRLISLPLGFSPRAVFAMATILPFQAVYLFSYFKNGIDDFGYAISIFVSFFVLPGIFLLVYPSFLSYIDGSRFESYLRTCILTVAIYGIFLFFWHPLTGHFIEIPYLTVNAADYGLLETTKNIARGDFFKLIATYNNGNLYGVATLILLPIYNLLESKRWRRSVIKIALVLTLSRTVWAGLIVDQVLSLLWLLRKSIVTFPRLYLGGAAKRVVAVAITIGLVLSALLFNSNTIAFLFDPTLGGRSGESAAFLHPTFLPDMPLAGFAEMLYSSALTDYGIVGLLSVLLIFLGPIILFTINTRIARSPVKMAALKGLILYAIVATIDGATNLIPVMAFYWFAYMTFIFGLPGEEPDIPLNEARTIPEVKPSIEHGEPLGAAALL